MEKLGVRPGHRISVLGLADPGLLAELRAQGADVATRRRHGSNLILFGASHARDLSRIGALEPYLARDGGIWVVYPRGTREVREVDVIAAGVAQGLVDNKVVRFSETHTALRFVIPRARR
jgi:hypothetical protein